MVVWGDVTGESITFRTYDASTVLTYEPFVQVRFGPNTVEGTASFPVALDASTPLPVELSAFTATLDGSDVLLRWTTEGETNNAGFEVQRRVLGDGTLPETEMWQPVAFVGGHGTTAVPRTYSHVATGVPPGSYLFRLKQLDYDGGFHYSGAVEVKILVDATMHLTRVAPNPFAETLDVTISTPHAQQVRVALYDLLGRLVATAYDGILQAGTSQRVTLGADLPGGLYFVRIQGERFTESWPITRLR